MAGELPPVPHDHPDDPHGGDEQHALAPKITEAELDRTLTFLFPSAAEAKAAGKRAMDSITGFPDELIHDDIDAMENRRGHLSWEGTLACDMTFQVFEDGRVSMSINKSYSEGTSLRQQLEKVLEQPSTLARASISLTFTTPADAKRYAEHIGIRPDNAALAEEMQQLAVETLVYRIRDNSRKTPETYDITELRDYFGDILLTLANHEDSSIRLATIRAVNEAYTNASTCKGKNYKGASEADMEHWTEKRFSDSAVETMMWNIVDLARAYDPAKNVKWVYQGEIDALYPGTYSGFYVDCFASLYQQLSQTARVELLGLLHAQYQRQQAKLGNPATDSLYLTRTPGDEPLTRYPIQATVPIPLGDPRLNATVEAWWEGVYNLSDCTFTPTGYPLSYTITVSPSETMQHTTSPEWQDMIMMTASKLALQQPDFLHKKVRRAKPDVSHQWMAQIFRHATLSDKENTVLENLFRDFLEDVPGRSDPSLN